MEIKTENGSYSIEECYGLLGLIEDSIVETDELFLDTNGNYSYSFDLKTDTPNQVVNYYNTL